MGLRKQVKPYSLRNLKSHRILKEALQDYITMNNYENEILQSAYLFVSTSGSSMNILRLNYHPC